MDLRFWYAVVHWVNSLIYKESYSNVLGGIIMTQYFVKKDFNPTFEKGSIPKLLYICNVDPTHTSLPRTMHMHNDLLEIIFIKEGNGSHLIGERQYKTLKGDILIYNEGVLHDEYGNPDTNMSVF